MLTLLVSNGKTNPSKLTKIVKYRRSKNSYLLRDVINFNEIFGKGVT